MRILKSFRSPNGLPIHPDNGYNGTYCLNSLSSTPTPRFDREVLGIYLVVTHTGFEPSECYLERVVSLTTSPMRHMVRSARLELTIATTQMWKLTN